MSIQEQSNKAIQASLIMAVITLSLALFAVTAETMEESQAKALVLPTLYALIGMSSIIAATGIAGVIHRNKKDELTV
jgi:hypothetical protein